MAITPRNGDLTAGVASQWSETIGGSPDPLITGDAPALATEPLPVAATQVLVARTVVGMDASGNIVPAVMGSVDAIGYIMYAINTTGAAAGAVEIEVVRQGVFNPDLLVWDASYATPADKRGAFRGAPTPTNIIIRRPTAMVLA